VKHSPCQREGCARTTNAASPHRYCSFVCHVVEDEMDQIRRVCEAVGESPLTAELWAAAVQLGDTWTECQWLNKRLFDATRDAGINADEFYAIRNG
jgi:hypothetical protein